MRDRNDLPIPDTVPQKVGDLEIVPIFDAVATGSATAFYRMRADQPDRLGFRAEDWEPHRYLLAEGDTVERAFGGFLVRTGDRVVLIDAGIGPGQIGPYAVDQRIVRGGCLLDSLAAQGLAPTDVTDVVLTHLHRDHVGWAVANDGSTFPNAVVRCHAYDWDHFVPSLAEAADDLAVLAPRLQTWDHDGPLLPGIDVQLTPGHTPGSTIVIISSGADRAVLLGDVAGCPVELLDDEWAGIGDVDPQLAKRSKEALAKELEGTSTHIAAAHFPGMRFGRLLPAEGRRRWVVGK